MSAAESDFRNQARWCADLGSPFTSVLLTAAADDIAAGGVVAQILDGRGEGGGQATRSDAVALRLAGALHAAALTGRDPALAAVYPAQDANWSMDRVWPQAQAFLRREADWVRDFMRSPPQTNETGRAAGLASAFMWLADRCPGPFHMRELGASAGLNLNWDRFRFAYAPWARTQGAGPLIPTEVDGVLPAWRDIAIASRAACDQNPIDPRDPAQQLRLRSYVWADQTARMQRLEDAIALAASSDTRVEKADAAEWTARQLTGDLPEGTTVVYHSIFYQYPPKETRAAIADAIEAAGTHATAERRLAWVRLEPDSVLGATSPPVRFVVDVIVWDAAGRTRIVLAEADPHGRTLKWLLPYQ